MDGDQSLWMQLKPYGQTSELMDAAKTLWTDIKPYGLRSECQERTQSDQNLGISSMTFRP